MKQQKILLLSFPEADVPRHFMYKLPVIGYKAKAHRYISAILKHRNEEILTAWDESILSIKINYKRYVAS